MNGNDGPIASPFKRSISMFFTLGTAIGPNITHVKLQIEPDILPSSA
jgi:hypothetical protein